MAKKGEITKFTDKLSSIGQDNLSPDNMRVKIFADGADKDTMLGYYRNPLIRGFTTNPTLMRKAGVINYEIFAREILSLIPDRPICFEVFSDDFAEMEKQAKIISNWGKNVYVKIPITNTKQEPSTELIQRLTSLGIKLNITAMTLYEQVTVVAPLLAEGAGGIVSIFAGRIADAGCDPVPVMKRTVAFLENYTNVELLWASPRELYNLVQAERIGCHIITMTDEILKKLPLLGGDLQQVSLDTVRMFYSDAHGAGYQIETAKCLVNSAMPSSEPTS